MTSLKEIRILRILIFSLSFFLLVISSSISDDKPSIEGKVFDAMTKQPVYGASVILAGTRYGTTTKEDGAFTIPDILPGEYTVNISNVGYQSFGKTVMITGTGVEELMIFLEPTVVPVDKVTVTASRFREEIFSVPMHISATRKAEFTERNYSTTAELLREEPGILVQKTTYGHGAPVVRGLIGKYVLLLYDGIRLNKPTFRFGANQYLNTIDAETLDRIEVVRGPSSVMYGSDAIGGVVNLIPETPSSAKSVSISPRFVGHYSTADDGMGVHLNLSGNYGHVAVDMGATYKDMGDLRAGGDVGAQSPTGWEEADYSSRILYKISEGGSVSLDYMAVRQNRVPRYDKYVSGQFKQYVYDPQDRDMAAFSFRAVRPASFVHSLKASISYQKEIEGRTTQEAGSPDITRERDEVLTWGGCLQLSSSLSTRHWLTYGLEYYRDRIKSERFLTSEGVTETVRPAYPDNSKYRSAGIFLQDALMVRHNMKITAGVRFSYFGVDSPLEGLFGRFKTEYENLTGSLALSYRPVSSVNLIGRWSQGFRAPNLNDAVVLKYSSSGVDAPSPDLDSERSDNFEFGTKVNNHIISGSFFLFYNRLVDLIDRRPGLYNGLTFLDLNDNGVKDPLEFGIYQKYNVGRASIYGFEYESLIKFGRGWESRVNCFWTRGENESEAEPLSRIPPLMGMVAVRRHLGSSAWVEVFVRAAGAQTRLSARDKDDTRIDPDGTPAWTTLNFRSGIEIDQFHFNVTFENINDLDYKEHGSGIFSPGQNIVLSFGYGI
jgi:outer membrane receptor protein involved in Fe transport